MREQSGLIQELLGERSFLLIILDACRYDAFKAEMNSAWMQGRLEAVHSPASCTEDWLLSQFTESYPDITVISAHPALNSKAIPVWGFRATDHFVDIMDVWVDWDDELGTVHPEKMYKAYKKRLERKKVIMWFLQPHGPWIGETKLALPQSLQLESRPVAGSDLKIVQMVREGQIDVNMLRGAYRDNLRLVLEHVKDCVTSSKAEKIVVTADHGEMLGEDWNFLHPCEINNEILRTVPWLEIKRSSDG